MEQSLLTSGIKRKGWYGGVGSRDTPTDVCQLMEQISLASYAIGFALSSGDAEGADKAFYAGAVQSSNFDALTARIYLSANYVRGRTADPSSYFYNATLSPNWTKAIELATIARGSLNGLNDWGIALHARNVFQILGESLVDPVGATIFWAIPKGSGKTVAGGTNTAFQVAKNFNIPTIINLYKEADRRRAEAFVEKYLPKGYFNVFNEPRRL